MYSPAGDTFSHHEQLEQLGESKCVIGDLNGYEFKVKYINDYLDPDRPCMEYHLNVEKDGKPYEFTFQYFDGDKNGERIYEIFKESIK